MKNVILTMLALCATWVAHSAKAGEEVDRLLGEYSKIETVTCQIRRTKEGDLGKMKFLSRVYWTNQSQLHSEGISPLKRRTIVDGQQLWQYVQGDPKGFSRPIGELSEQMRISLEMVPGTPMDQLLRLKDLDETALADDAQPAKRIGIKTDNQYVLLRFDQQNRLTGMDFFKTEAMEEKTVSYAYSDFLEAVPGTWVPLTHEVAARNDGSEFRETIKVDRFIANEPIAESLFIPSSFFDKNIDFVDDFAKIFPE